MENEIAAQLEAAGFQRQSSRTTGGWLVYYSHPETWETTEVVFVPDNEEGEHHGRENQHDLQCKPCTL